MHDELWHVLYASQAMVFIFKYSSHFETQSCIDSNFFLQIPLSDQELQAQM